MQTMQAPGQLHSKPYGRILAVKLADLGDLLTVTPALQALHSSYPEAEIDLLAQPSSASILEGAPYLSSIIPFDGFSSYDPAASFHPLRLAKIARFLLALRLRRYDAFAIFHHTTTPWGAWQRTMLTMAVRARAVAGLDSDVRHARLFTKMLTHKTPDRGFGAQHEATYWLDVAAGLGADTRAGWPMHIPLTDEHRACATELLDGESVDPRRPLVAVHPGAGAFSRARIWPTARFAAVAQRLVSEQDAQVMLIGGPDETDAAREMITRMGSLGEGVINTVGKTSLHQTAALLEKCGLFLGGDSGPMHMAAAVGTPVVAVFGPSNHKAWGPYTPGGQPVHHTVVKRDLPCQPCFYRAYSLGLREGCGTRPCLMGLGVEPVLAACIDSLARHTSAKAGAVV